MSSHNVCGDGTDMVCAVMQRVVRTFRSAVLYFVESGLQPAASVEERAFRPASSSLFRWSRLQPAHPEAPRPLFGLSS